MSATSEKSAMAEARFGVAAVGSATAERILVRWLREVRFR